MAINISMRQDVSYLFSSLGSSTSNVASSNFLGQYASIKNGSYAKLLKAYYNETGSKTNSNSATSSKTQTTGSATAADKAALKEVQTATDDLKESADALLVKGSKSVFAMKDITSKDENGVESTKKGYDVEVIYKAVNNFVTDYNKVIDKVNDVDNKSIVNRTTNLVDSAISNVKLLNKIGITINEDSTLSLDKATFEKADMSRVEAMFNSTGSFGYSVSSRASMINYSADRAIAKADTYTANATYNNVFDAGSIFNVTVQP